MEKYATYDYYKNKTSGEIKKVSLHDGLNLIEEGTFIKEGEAPVWIKITNEKEINKIEAKK